MFGINFKNMDFSFRKENWLTILAIVFSIVYVVIFHVNVILENTLMENFQLIPLIIAFILCVKAKNNKNFFALAAIVIAFMFLRELSYGRAIFCLMPNDPYNAYPWSHYKYGFLADYVIGLIIGLCAVWFFIKKVYLDIIDVLKKTLFPIWTFLGAFVLIFLQIYSEKALESTVVEEISEFALYFSILAIVIIYKKQLDK